MRPREILQKMGKEGSRINPIQVSELNFEDHEVRRAARLAVGRSSSVRVVEGSESPWYGKFTIRYNGNEGGFKVSRRGYFDGRWPMHRQIKSYEKKRAGILQEQLNDRFVGGHRGQGASGLFVRQRVRS